MVQTMEVTSKRRLFLYTACCGATHRLRCGNWSSRQGEPCQAKWCRLADGFSVNAFWHHPAATGANADDPSCGPPHTAWSGRSDWDTPREGDRRHGPHAIIWCQPPAVPLINFSCLRLDHETVWSLAHLQFDCGERGDRCQCTCRQFSSYL